MVSPQDSSGKTGKSAANTPSSVRKTLPDEHLAATVGQTPKPDDDQDDDDDVLILSPSMMDSAPPEKKRFPLPARGLAKQVAKPILCNRRPWAMMMKYYL